MSLYAEKKTRGLTYQAETELENFGKRTVLEQEYNLQVLVSSKAPCLLHFGDGFSPTRKIIDENWS